MLEGDFTLSSFVLPDETDVAKGASFFGKIR
jgi:hypothetical protein